MLKLFEFLFFCLSVYTQYTGNAHTFLYKVSQLRKACQSKNQALWLKEIPAELRDKIVTWFRPGKDYYKICWNEGSQENSDLHNSSMEEVWKSGFFQTWHLVSWFWPLLTIKVKRFHLWFIRPVLFLIVWEFFTAAFQTPSSFHSSFTEERLPSGRSHISTKVGSIAGI